MVGGLFQPLAIPLVMPLQERIIAPLSKGGYDLLDAILGAGGADYAFYDFTRLPFLFQDSAGTTPVTTVGQSVGRANVVKKSSHNAQQASGSFKPQFQATGAKFDGSDDNLISDWVAGAGMNCILAQVNVPASISATQVIAGALNAANIAHLGIITSGNIRAAIGGASYDSAGVDVRGTDCVIGWSADGSGYRLFRDGAVVGSGAITTNVWPAGGLRIGALDNAGIAANFFAGSVKRLVLGKKFLTLTDVLAIRARWLSA